MDSLRLTPTICPKSLMPEADLPARHLGSPTQSPEVRHRAVLPEEGVDGKHPGGGVAGADDLPRVVDASGLAESAAERPEVRHRAVLPEEGVLESRGRAALTDDLSKLVDAGGHAEAAA